MKRFLLSIFLILALCLPVSSQQQAQLPQVPDQPIETLQFAFNGQWLPSADPAQIGPENYRILTNLRYTPSGGLESVGGYTKINTSAISGSPEIDAGFHFKKDNPAESHVLVNADGVIYENTTAIPSAGAFTSTAIHTDYAGAGTPRFSQAPYGHVAYANGVEAMVWAGEEMPVAAFITSSTSIVSSPTSPKDYTEAVNNNQTDAKNIATVTPSASSYWLVGSPRPLKGVKYYIGTANVTTSTMTASHWTGAAWTPLSITDNTATAGVSLAKTGTVTWPTAVSTSKVKFIDNRLFYWYQFNLDAGNATIYRTTLDAPWQNLVDIWDGVLRQPIQFQAYKSAKYEDYTAEVNESLPEYYGDLGGMTAAEHLILMFDDRSTAIKFVMVAGKENVTTSTPTISYWAGAAWTSVGTVADTTLDAASSTKSLGQSGVMSWSPPSSELEFQQTLFGKTGYAYKIVWSGTLTASNAWVNTVTGVPAQKEIPPFKFPTIYKDRLFLCGYTEGSQGNRCDYSMSHAPQVFNGAETSDGGIQSLYFGGEEELTAATQLYNRMGSNIFIFFLALKENETYVMTGDGPDNFAIFPVSTNIGCPSPNSLRVAEVGFDIANDVQRHVALWVSYAGPVIFDGAVIYQIPGLENYFDPNHPDYLGQAVIQTAFAWFDQTYKEYNIIIGSYWFSYNLRLKKWFKKDPGTAEYPISAWPVRDTAGNEYVYAGLDNGFVMRLEYGTSWSGVGINQRVQTGDFWPTKNIWDLTRIRRIKLVAKRISEANTLRVIHYADGDEIALTDWTWEGSSEWNWQNSAGWVWDAGNSVLSLELSGSDTSNRNRIVRTTQPVNILAWNHELRFEITTSNTEKGFQPVLWGIEFTRERRDH